MPDDGSRNQFLTSIPLNDGDRASSSVELAQAAGETTNPPNTEARADIQLAVLATYESALADGASLEEAAQLAFEAALEFGASEEEAQFAVSAAIEVTYEALLSSGASQEEASAFVNLAVEAAGTNSTGSRVSRAPQTNSQNNSDEAVDLTSIPDGIGQLGPPGDPTLPLSPSPYDSDILPGTGLDLTPRDVGITDFVPRLEPPPPPDAPAIVPRVNPLNPTTTSETTSPATTTSSSTSGVVLSGGTSNIILTGGSGEDSLSGGSGSDILVGGGGNDALLGGSGNDTYKFSPGFGNDSVTDEAGSADQISGFSIGNLSNAAKQGDDLVLDFYSGDTVTVKNHFLVGNEVEILVSGTDNYGLNGQTSGVKGQIVAGLVSTDETLSGATGDDVIFGGDGADVLQGGSGNNFLNGGSGTDTLMLTGNFADYTIAVQENGYLVTDSVSSRDGINTIRDIENLQFADMTLTAAQAITTPDYVTGVLYDNSYSRWNADTSIGSAVSLTYSFMDSLPSYYGSEIVSFSIFSTAQETAARTVLGLVADAANLTFTEVADTGSGGQLRFGGSAQSTSAGFAYAPSVNYTLDGVNYIATEKSGDVFIANNQTSSLTLTNGAHGYFTLLHEVGHATGITHTFEGTNQLSAATDNNQYSVMSYTEHPKAKVVDVTGDESSYSASSYNWNPETFMINDIATLQHLYGSNLSTRTGNDTYTFDPSARFFQAIWDGDGTDTIDASNFSRDSIIDLNPGTFSSIGIYDPVSSQLPSWYAASLQPDYDGRENVGVAYGAMIENATGGSGNDVLTGNYIANTLTGGDGNDTLTGGAGNDILLGGAGNDTYAISSGSGGDTITDSSGTQDLISGFTIDNLANAVQQADDLVLSFTTGDMVTVKNHFTTGNEVEIFVSGTDYYGLTGQTSGVVGQIITDPSSSGASLIGGSGNDLIFGGDGADTLQGGSGTDTLTGGAGNDIFYFVAGDGNDAITDFSRGYDIFHVSSSSFGISSISFEAISATYDGTNALNGSTNVVRDGNNDLYIDTNGQVAGGYSLVANVQNDVAVDEQDLTLV